MVCQKGAKRAILSSLDPPSYAMFDFSQAFNAIDAYLGTLAIFRGRQLAN